MKLTIMQAGMTHTQEDGYVGTVHFRAEGHKHPYEITLHSKNGKEWSYGLFFLEESGSEDDIYEVEEYLEENDDAFDSLVDAAKGALQQ